MIISIKNLRENCIMLLLIQEVLGGGTVKIERKAQYVTYIAIKKRFDTNSNRDIKTISFINYT